MKSRGVTITGVINDLHRPWHDPHAVRLALNIFEYANVNRIVINGDLVDFYNLNQHGPKHPDIKTTLRDELDDTLQFLQKLRKRFPRAEIVYIYGNHEDRLDRFIVKYCKLFWDILTLDKYFMLDTLKIKWLPYNEKYRLEKTNLYIQHSPPSYAKNGAMTSLEKKLDRSFLWGCTHRAQIAKRTGASGARYHGIFNGWLGHTKLSKEHKRVFSYCKNHESWEQCLTIVYALDKKEFWYDQISIENKKAIFQGKVFK